MNRLRDVLELVRFPNVLTTPGDVVAGFVLGGGVFLAQRLRDTPDGDKKALVLAVVASAMMYSGGMALNDACDAEKDRLERPTRPIPSGRVSRKSAFVAAAILLLCGCAVAAAASAKALIVALGTCASIVAYDAVFKSTPLAPGLMGACRALNMALGVAAAGGDWACAPLAPLACLWLYVTGVTFFARTESRRSSPARLAIGALVVVLATLAVAVMGWLREGALLAALPAVALAGWLAVLGSRATTQPTPETVRSAMRSFLLGIIAFDACVIWVWGGKTEAVAVALLMVPSAIASRRFHMT